jgi:hypothetical protein
MTNKSRIIFAIVGFIIFSFCIEGWAEDWKLIRKDAQGGVWEIDVASISHQPNNIVEAWFKFTYSKESINELVKKFGEQYKDGSHSVMLYEYYCTEKKYHILRSTAYSLEGNVIFSNNSPTERESLVPDSVGEDMFKEVCK